jgi:hypothetical protein
MSADHLSQLIRDAFHNCPRGNDDDGWVNLAKLGTAIHDLDPDFRADAHGHEKLSKLLASRKDILELRADTSGEVPVMFARLLARKPAQPISRGADTLRATYSAPALKLAAPSVVPSRVPALELQKWAWLGHYPDILKRLNSLALDEDWEFRHSQPNPEKPFPILLSYLTYTFYRLKIEGKILVKRYNGQSYAAMNTGLVDKRYEPIYALFRPNQPGRSPDWQLENFCIAAEDSAGKTLVSHFNPLPQSAHYFTTFSDVLYDIESPEPQLDWEHIILENIDRIPHELVSERCPPDFNLRDANSLTFEERGPYYRALRDAIKNNKATYRAIKNRMEDALELSLKRVRWNFKTAIPTYFPKSNKISLLLPLAIISDEKVDRALVVERTQSGNYLGHTILPLDWAYNNARLVCRPDSDWLAVQNIESASTFDSDPTEG